MKTFEQWILTEGTLADMKATVLQRLQTGVGPEVTEAANKLERLGYLKNIVRTAYEHAKQHRTTNPTYMVELLTQLVTNQIRDIIKVGWD